MATPEDYNDYDSSDAIIQAPSQETNLPDEVPQEPEDPESSVLENGLNDAHNNGGSNFIVGHEEVKLQEIQAAKEYTEEEIRNRLKDIKDIKELRKVLEQIVGSMESQFTNTLKKYDKKDRVRGVYDGRGNLDEDTPVEQTSVFERRGLSILQRAQDIMTQIEEGDVEVSLLTLFNQASSELFQSQKYVQDLYKRDMEDGIPSLKELVSMEELRSRYELGGDILFNEHNESTIRFHEDVRKKPLATLIGELFSITEGAGAFIDGYEELKKRLNGKNLFQVIDDIAADGIHDREIDWTADVIELRAIRGLLKRGKIEDFDKYLSTYKDAERIKQNMKRTLRMEMMDNLGREFDVDSFTADFLTHFDDVKNSVNLKDMAEELEKLHPVVSRFDSIKEGVHAKKVDIIEEGRVNGLLLFDNDDTPGSGASFFEGNINMYKSSGYTVKIDESNKDMRKVVMESSKNKDDKITLVRLKEKDKNLIDESYARVINQLKDGGYNIFSLRGHCYNTIKMAPLLSQNKMIKEGSILIDGGCGNYSAIGSYMEKGINCPMFSYTSTGKGDTTAALFNLIISEKDSGGNLGTILEHIEEASNKKDKVYQHMQSILKPDSPYYLYLLSGQKSQNTGEETQNYDEGIQDYDENMQDYDEKTQDYDGEIQDYDENMQDHGEQMQDYDEEIQDHGEQMQEYDEGMQEYTEKVNE